MRRGEVWWAELPEPLGRRPVLLLSRSAAYLRRTMITVAPVTTRIRNLRCEVGLGLKEGMPKPCVANLDNINTIDKSRLGGRIVTLPPEKMAAVEVAIQFALGFGESP